LTKTCVNQLEKLATAMDFYENTNSLAGDSYYDSVRTPKSIVYGNFQANNKNNGTLKSLNASAIENFNNY